MVEGHGHHQSPKQGMDGEGALPTALVVFDGQCGLCDATVQRLLRWDQVGRLSYTPYQGETFQPILARHPSLRPEESITFVVQGDGGEEVYTHAEAFFEISRRLPWPWRVISWARWIPLPLSNALYRLVARYRLRIWGEVTACRLPTGNERRRFLP